METWRCLCFADHSWLDRGHWTRSLSSLFVSRISGLGNQPLANGTDAIASLYNYDTTFYFTTSLLSYHQHLYIHAYIYTFYNFHAIYATIHLIFRQQLNSTNSCHLSSPNPTCMITPLPVLEYYPIYHRTSPNRTTHEG